MSLKTLLFGKKLEREEKVAYLLREIGWIKRLEKQHLKLEEQVRKAQTDRKRLATRITALERKRNA